MSFKFGIIYNGDLAEPFDAKEDYTEISDAPTWFRSKTEGFGGREGKSFMEKAF